MLRTNTLCAVVVALPGEAVRSRPVKGNSGNGVACAGRISSTVEMSRGELSVFDETTRTSPKWRSDARPSGSTRTSLPLGWPGRLAFDGGLTETNGRDADVLVDASQKYPAEPV